MIYITKLEMADGSEQWWRVDRHEHRHCFPLTLFWKSPDIHYLSLGASMPSKDDLIRHLKSRYPASEWSEPEEVDYADVVHSCSWYGGMEY